MRSQVEKAKDLEEKLSKGKSALIDLKNEALGEKSVLKSSEVEEIFAIKSLSTAKQELLELEKQLESTTEESERKSLKAKQALIEKLKEQLQIESDLKSVEGSIGTLWKDNSQAIKEAKVKIEGYKETLGKIQDLARQQGIEEQFSDLFEITKLEKAGRLLEESFRAESEATTIQDQAQLSIKREILENLYERLRLEEEVQDMTKQGHEVSKKIEEEKKRAEMSGEERAIYDFQQSQKRKEEEFEKEKKKLEREMEIHKFFQEQKFHSSAEVAKLITADHLENYNLEERELILKLARERIQLEQQKEEKIRLEEDVHRKFNQLSNDTTNLQIKNLGKLKNEYRNLIAQIETALAKQAQLRGGRGFAIGGFTGSGMNHEIAGVVHKNERVAPARMTSKFADTFNQLEKIRTRGFAQGGFTSDHSRHIEQNNTINVQNVFDVEEFLDKQRWKMR